VLRYGLDYPGLVGVENNSVTSIPDNFELSQNYPNPFNPVTNIKYAVANSSEVSLTIYDILGNEVRTLVSNEMKNAGTYNIEWNGKNNSGLDVSSGVYFYKLIAGEFSKTLKITMLK
ncbi:MAG: T9SS type A sorting domain-containing protein, partial [bacterium]